MNLLHTTVVAAALAVAPISLAQAETLKAEGGSAAGLSALVPQLLSKYATDSHEVRVNVDQTLTRSALKVATGATDIAAVPMGAYLAMTKGVGPYKKLEEEAVEASGNIRALFAFIGGHAHVMTYENSGVETWEDLRGKRVFVGPPAGSFSVQTTKLITAITGMQEGEDYEAIRLAWGAANQAFEDGKFDVFIRPGTVGSAAIDQFGSATKFRLMGVPDEVLETEAWKTYISTPGYAPDVIQAGTYGNQANSDEDVLASAFVMFIAAHKDMSDETAYDLTKAMFSNLDDAHSVNQGLKPLTLDNAFVSLAAPIHPGAVRFYDEMGIEVPEALRP